MQYSALNLQFDDDLATKPWSGALTFVKSPRNITALSFGLAGSTFGPLSFFWAGDQLFYVGMKESRSLEKVQSLWPQVELTRDDKTAAQWAKRIDALWSGKKLDAPIRLAVDGTPFQMDVWNALMRIPAGHVVSYGTVAAAVGRPKAVRAVGTAVGSNPITLLIPCHRVIQKNGSVKNYGWGDAAKQRILKIESEA